MAVNIPSLQARLLNAAKERKVDHQVLFNRFGAEQFLERLSRFGEVRKFVLKGGALLTYLIETDRRTKDLDFSVYQRRVSMDGIEEVIQSILKIELDDGIGWGAPSLKPLHHPAMKCPGVRISIPFQLGKSRGLVRMDIAVGDRVTGAKTRMSKIRYRGRPLAGEDFDLWVYPAEAVFAEKLQIALVRREANTRMKDYYDLFKLTGALVDTKKLANAIRETFKERGVKLEPRMRFDPGEMTRLQIYWSHYRRKERLNDVPEDLSVLMASINRLLGKVFPDE